MTMTMTTATPQIVRIPADLIDAVDALAAAHTMQPSRTQYVAHLIRVAMTHLRQPPRHRIPLMFAKVEVPDAPAWGGVFFFAPDQPLSDGSYYLERAGSETEDSLIWSPDLARVGGAPYITEQGTPWRGGKTSPYCAKWMAATVSVIPRPNDYAWGSGEQY